MNQLWARKAYEQEMQGGRKLWDFELTQIFQR